MKHHTTRLFFILALALTLAAPAIAENGASGYKIGVVDRKRVFEEYEKQKELLGGLEAEAQRLEEELNKEIEAFEQEFERIQQREESGILSEDELLDLQQQFRERENTLKSKKQEWQRNLDIKTERVLSEIRRDIYEAVQVVGNQNDYHLILEADQDPRARTSVLYYVSAIDVTQKVIDHLNEQYASN